MIDFFPAVPTHDAKKLNYFDLDGQRFFSTGHATISDVHLLGIYLQSGIPPQLTPSILVHVHVAHSVKQVMCTCEWFNHEIKTFLRIYMYLLHVCDIY